MGLLSKSIVLLLIAVSTPLLYRQFANDNTVRYLSTYYSNYKSIDHFLRQSAGHLDKARDYLPDQHQINYLASKVHTHVGSLIESTKSKLSNLDLVKQQAASPKQAQKPTLKIRYCKCPSEDSGESQIRLWRKEELAKYDGNSGESDIYLGFLGLVYNVTVNSQHYAPGADYNAFAGRDATRAFLTGNFTHDLHDDIKNVDLSLYAQLETWATFYQSNYPVLGRVEGQFFDSKGCGTPALLRVKQAIDASEKAKIASKQQEKVLPECNSEWNGDLKQGKVWCSTKSGGIERDWAGVPRLYSAGESQRCVCFNLDGPEANSPSKSMSVYPGCDPKASECLVAQ